MARKNTFGDQQRDIVFFKVVCATGIIGLQTRDEKINKKTHPKKRCNSTTTYMLQQWTLVEPLPLAALLM